MKHFNCLKPKSLVLLLILGIYTLVCINFMPNSLNVYAAESPSIPEQSPTPTNTSSPESQSDDKDNSLSLTYKATNPSIYVGRTYKLTFKENIKDVNKVIKWSLSNNNVKINSYGVVTGLKPGTTLITATYIKNTSIKATIKITVKKINVTKITVPSSLSIPLRESRKITPSVSPTNATNKAVSYKSSNNKICTVDSKGNVKAKAKGTAYITVTSKDQSKISKRIKVTVTAIRIVLDPGHGGSDSGATRGKIYEKTINLQMAKACKQELEKYSGVDVLLTRSYDKKLSLKDRAKIAKNNNANILISLHQNALNKKATGSLVIVSQSTYKPIYNKESTKLASSILSHLRGYGFSTFNQKANFGLPKKGILTRSASYDRYSFDKKKADYYGVIRNSIELGIPAIIIEHGYMDSTDYYKMNTIYEQNKIGMADATGIAKYYKLKKIKK